MLLWQAIILAVIQGVGELFPVSSLAQTILIPAMLGWNINAEGTDYLAFVVALHLATAIALLIYFWKDWRRVVVAVLGCANRGRLIYDDDSKFAWLLVAGTIVVGGVGFVLEKHIRALFDEPRYYWISAAILIANGFVMIGGDYLKRRASREAGSDTADPAAMAPQQQKRAVDLSLLKGGAVGAAQTLALAPGISRSGVTIVAGLLAGLSYEEASRFSFMLATPVIGLAAVLKVPHLLKDKEHLPMAAIAAVVAGVTAFGSVAFLMRYFRHNRLSPFGYYCIGFGALAWGVLAFR